MEGKKGLPHLFNNGKPSEMSDKEFVKLLNWLDENEGVISDENASINEKLDGSSQFFGCDKTGFFWEKFGSDTRFYSIEEIPEYWAGYRRLFTDMYNVLYQTLRSLLTSEYKYGTGIGSVKEIKAQIEVITAAGSHNPNNYEINLVPYRKDAFKPNGCLSIIQALVDGKQDERLKEKIYNQLRHIHNYTVFAGYSLEDFEIDVTFPVYQYLKKIEDYPFEMESEKFGITLTEIEDVLDLPARKYNQSTLKGILSSVKEQLSIEILDQLKHKTGALTENGMFEGLAIVLDNGMAFKVNSPAFKAAFLKHKQDSVAKKMAKVSEAKEKKPKEEKVTSKKSELPKEIKDFFEDDELPIQQKLNKNNINDSLLIDIKEQIKDDISSRLENIIFSWKNNTGQINTFNVAGSEEVLEKCKVSDRKDGLYFIWLPYKGTDNRCYATGVLFRNKNSDEFASVKDGLNFPQDHTFTVIYLRKHNEKNMSGDTKIQECLQGIACDLAKESSSAEILKEKILDKIRKNGFDSIPISGGTLKVGDFTEEKLNQYIDPAVKTGMAFIEEFSEVVSPSTKVYHPDNNGPLKMILDKGKPYLNGLKKDCWNPTDILVTDFTSEELKKIFINAKSIADMNMIMKDLIKNSIRGRCFIPLSLKLNTSKERDSVVEKINLEDEMTDYHVSSHYVNSNGVGNAIEIYAHINNKSYKFNIRHNGTKSPIIEGQHLDVEKYLKNDKFVDDTTENRNIISRDDIDIEGYRVNEKDNTSSFLGKSKSILFSVMDETTFNNNKTSVNFSMENRHQFHEGSLPWRLIEVADKIDNLPDGYGARGNQEGHNSKIAHDVAELARDFAKLIVLMKWSTEEAIIYLLTCSMKENYGVFNTFAPLYKIS